MTKKIKISVALHTQEPDIDGNQSQFELGYMNYNRRHIFMTIDDNGDGFFQATDLQFPSNGEYVAPVATWFSIGVAVAPANQGGAIINAGPIGTGPIIIVKGRGPMLTIAGGIHAERLNKMRLAGKFFDSVAPDHEHGLNLPE
jgi:hypothetical protein